MEHEIKKKLVEICEILRFEKISDSKSYSIASGNLGIVIFLHIYSKFFNDEELENICLDTISEINFKINNTSNLKLSFIDGFSGYCWFMSFFNKTFYELDDSFLKDETMISVIKNDFERKLTSNNYDYLHGAFGHYITLCELNAGFDSDIEKMIFNYFEAYNIPFTITEGKKVYNLGLSHGLSSLISILSIAKRPSTIPILERLISYILTFYDERILDLKNKEINRSIFPSYIHYSNNEKDNSRLAWCYGDLGIASALWQGGVALNKKDYKMKALDILIINSKRRDLSQNGVYDAGICHGASGIAHIFNRFYKETNIKEFDDARWYWLHQTLNMTKFNDGLAGYKSWQGEFGWKNDKGFLEGISGIGLVLMGFLTEDINDLRWDRCLLLS